MTLADLRNDLGSKINQYDESTDAFVAGFITEDEADRWINQSFMEVYKWYALAVKGRFLTTATADTVADQAIYTFGGEATDILAVSSVEVKLTDDDTEFTRAYPARKTDIVLAGNEEIPENAPVFYEKMVYNTTTGHYVLSIEFPEDCIPQDAVTGGLVVEYVARPPIMDEDTDIPERLPDELHSTIVRGAAIPCFEKMGEWDVAAQIEAGFDKKVKSFMIQDQSIASKGVKRVKRTRKSVNKFYMRNR